MKLEWDSAQNSDKESWMSEFNVTCSGVQLSPTDSHFGVVVLSNLYHLLSSVLHTHEIFHFFDF